MEKLMQVFFKSPKGVIMGLAAVGTAFLIVLSTVVYADSLANKASLNVEASKQERGAICKYVMTSSKIYTSVPKPDLFKNVLAVFIKANVASELQSISSLNNSNLATLASCITKNSSPSSKNIPVYIPERKESFILGPQMEISGWPETKKEGNLFIEVNADLVKGDMLKQNIIKLHVRYYRLGIDRISNIWGLGPECVEVLPYTEQEDAFQRALTAAAEVCLKSPYFLGAAQTK